MAEKRLKKARHQSGNPHVQEKVKLLRPCERSLLVAVV